MEPDPTTLPPRRLHPAFWLVFPAPLVIGAVILALVQGENAGVPIGWTMLLSVFCAIASAILLGRGLARTTGGRIFLGLGSLVLLQVFYLVALFAGCTASSGSWNMK